MKNNLSRQFVKLTISLILLVAAACTAKITPTATQSAPTQTSKPSETKPTLTVTRTKRVKASNTPLGGRAPTSVTPVQNKTGSPPPGQSQTIVLTRLPQGNITATLLSQTQSALSSTPPEFTETITPTGPTPTPTITPTPTPIQNNGPIDLQDGLGRMVHLPGPAMKVVSLAPSNTEIMDAIGAWSQMVGRDVFSDYPEGALTLPSVGGINGSFDLQAISNLQPDLVLMAGINNPNLVANLVSRNLTVFYLANPVNMDGLYANLRSVAKLTSHIQETEALITGFGQRMSVLQEIIGSAETHPKVFIELDGTNPANPWTCGPGSYLDAMITLAGGQNIGASLTSPWGQMSTAQIATHNPDIIILADAFYGITPDEVAARPGWGNIRAVLDDNIIPFNDDNLISRPGPRLLDGIESLAEIIHPELFQLP